MRILITGATGFIGKNLLERLAKEKIKLELLFPCRDITRANNLFNRLSLESLKIVPVNDYESIREFNPEIVIHLAAFSTSSNDTAVISKLIESNISFGVRILDALRDCSGMKLFINTGSFAEYRKGPASIDNAYLYTATKSAFRPLLDYYANISDYKYITAIPYSVYGGNSKVKRIFDYMLEALDTTEPVGMSSGYQILDFIHVDDICNFFVKAITHLNYFLSLPQGKEFHLGTGIGHNLHEVATLMEEASQKKINIAWGKIPYRERDVMHAVAPISCNENLWEAKISLREGMEKFIRQNL